MDINGKIKLLEIRLQNLNNRKKDNGEVCRKVRRNIRNLQKKL